jgi:UDP:flavonoid glycosyltransferase YjiC (YdhE family)
VKILLIADGSPATVFAVTPLATALRNAGHEILLAANEPLMASAEAIGIPAVSVTPEPIGRVMAAGRRENAIEGPRDLRGEMFGIGRGFARMASAVLDPLFELTEDWPADVVVGGSMSYAAGLLAARIKVPYVRQAWDIVPMTDPDAGAEYELRAELERLGLPGLPDPALFIDVCPPSLQLAHDPGAQLMRWIPINRQRRLEPWMYTRPNGRPRVLITSGTRNPALRTPGSSMRQMVDHLLLTGAEVLIAAPERVAEEFGAELDDVRIGWLPLDVVTPTCDVAVHHGGATTAMTVMASGVPQLIIPENAHTRIVAQLLSGFGAALILEPPEEGPDQGVAEAIAAGCQQILSSPSYADRARALASEIAALPPPADVVLALEALTATVSA